MTEELSSLLLTRDGQRRLDADVADMIRKPDFAAAEQFLLDGFRANPSPVSDVCLTLSVSDVRITGWEKLDAEIERFAGAGKECTVVGIDLSNYSDPAVDPWHCKEPVIESWYGDDDTFSFSSASRDDILRENDRVPLDKVAVCFISGPLVMLVTSAIITNETNIFSLMIPFSSATIRRHRARSFRICIR